MKSKIIILLLGVLLHLQVSAQSEGKRGMQLSVNLGINNYKSEVLDLSLLYKTRKNFTYSVGFGGFNTDKYGPGFLTAFLNFGKIWAIKNSRFFINAKTGPVYNAEFSLGNIFNFHYHLGTDSGSGASSGTTTPPPKEKKYFPIGLQSSVSGSYQVFKFAQIELGVNSNLNSQKSFAGIFLGVKFTWDWKNK